MSNSAPCPTSGVRILLACLLVIASFTLSTASPVPTLAASPPPLHTPGASDPLPARGALFGASVAVRDNQLHWTAQLDFEEQVGRKMALDKEGHFWDDAWPSAYEHWSRDQGRSIVFSWHTTKRGGDTIRWAAIAAGRHDAEVDAKAEAIKAFGAPVTFVFNHEPERDVGVGGTAEDFVRAYRHVHDRFEALGVTNVSHALVLMAFTYRQGDPDQYYPGDDYVDLVGANGYNWFTCDDRDEPWESFQVVFEATRDYAVDRGKPVYVAEWGSVEDPAVPGRKARWIADAAATMKTWPEVKLVTYYNNGTPAARCDWWIDSSQSSIDAFTDMGADPYFNPPLPSPDPSRVAAYLSVHDFFFSNTVGYPAQGKGVQWIFFGPSTHTVTDDSGMDMFDSGSRPAGTTYKFTFTAAGDYPYMCTIHADMEDTLKVPLLVRPLIGNLGTRFTVTWAAGSPPPGYVYDVKILRPGSIEWESWKDGVTRDKGSFVADAGRGTYSFHARIRNSRNGESSWYSDDVSIVVV